MKRWHERVDERGRVFGSRAIGDIGAGRGERLAKVAEEADTLASRYVQFGLDPLGAGGVASWARASLIRLALKPPARPRLRR